MFILASSVCKSLQYLTSTRSFISAHLFNCAAGREEHCKQISLACVGSAHSVSVTLGLPLLTACVLSWSTLLRLQVALLGNCLRWALGCVHSQVYAAWVLVLHKCTDSVGPVFCALPRSDQLRRPDTWRAHCPQCVVHLIISLFLAARFPVFAVKVPSQVCHMSPLWS